MGDLARRARPPTLDDEHRKKKEARKRARDAGGDRKDKRKRARDKEKGVFVAGRGSNVLTETQFMEANSYRPKTKETEAVYEQVLSFVQRCIGDQPQEFLRGAAEEALYIIKSDAYEPKVKQREVEKLLNKMPSERYNKLVNLSKAITDFTKDEDGDEEDVDASKAGEETLAVVMDSDESDESDVDSVIESESDPDDEEGVEASAGTQIGAADEDGDDDEGDEAGDSIPVSAIDAFWLQREISKFYSDATVAQKLADDVLDVLKLSVKDERERENKLVMLLDYDKFDFIKHLLVNRSKIMYCTRLKRAQTDDERAAIEAEMRADVSGG